jgi:hypothetical protein
MKPRPSRVWREPATEVASSDRASPMVSLAATVCREMSCRMSRSTASNSSKSTEKK